MATTEDDPRDVPGWHDLIAELNTADERTAGSIPVPAGGIYIVETSTTEGVHEVTAVIPRTRKAADGHPNLGETDLARLRSAARALLDLRGHREGPASVEVALTDDGPRVLSWRPPAG
jgi:hypothetical protein